MRTKPWISLPCWYCCLALFLPLRHIFSSKCVGIEPCDRDNCQVHRHRFLSESSEYTWHLFIAISHMGFIAAWPDIYFKEIKITIPWCSLFMCVLVMKIKNFEHQGNWNIVVCFLYYLLLLITRRGKKIKI